tara:strand:+ start:250 stop:864 length:615 start_codon:yes stop_codon:yes gene_type:complete
MELTLLNEYDVTRSGATVKLDPSKLNETMILALLAHGIAAKVGDSAASASAFAGESHFGKPKKECNLADWKAWQASPQGVKAIKEIAEGAMQSVLTALEAGNWSQAGTGGPRVARLPDDVTIAVKAAKVDLIILFKRVTGQSKLAEFMAHEKMEPFFTESDDGKVAWNDATCVQWIEKQKASGGRDYLAEAQSSLSVDLSALDL